MRRSDRPDLADFQCNGAMAAAKKLGKNPREIATAVVDALQGVAPGGVHRKWRGRVSSTCKLSADGLAKRAEEIAADERAGAQRVETPRRVVMDFGGWNVAKEMHIGHLRSTVIGDSLQRLFRFMGDKVTSDVHLGDWGLQMGQLINEVKLEQPGLPYFDAAFTGPYPEQSPVTMDDLSRLYPLASGKSKTDEARRRRGSQGDAGAAVGAAGLSRAVEALLQCHARGAGARVREPWRDVRSLEGRERCRALRAGDWSRT